MEIKQYIVKNSIVCPSNMFSFNHLPTWVLFFFFSPRRASAIELRCVGKFELVKVGVHF